MAWPRARLGMRGSRSGASPPSRAKRSRAGSWKSSAATASPAGAEGSGRRELADWLTRPENPLTARVMVNRIWAGHFGIGLVATENDFGRRGRPPTHPGLLDDLAHRFMAGGWSIKAMHRLIMLSATYQLSSESDSRPTRPIPPTSCSGGSPGGASTPSRSATRS